MSRCVVGASHALVASVPPRPPNRHTCTPTYIWPAQVPELLHAPPSTFGQHLAGAHTFLIWQVCEPSGVLDAWSDATLDELVFRNSE